MPKPLVNKLDPMDVTNKHLYMSTIDAAEDVTLKPRQKRIIVSSRPLWYADEDDSYLKPIDTTLGDTEDPETRSIGVGTTKNTLNFMALDNGDVVYYLRGHKLRLSPSQWPGQTERGQVNASRVSKTGAISVDYDVLPGQIKETIVVSDKKITSVAWDWVSNLIPVIVNECVSWRFNNREIFRFTPLSAWDSNGSKLKCFYQVTSGRVIVSFDEDEIKKAVYPVTIDPTVTTSQTGLVCLCTQDSRSRYEGVYIQFPSPALTNLDSLDVATLNVHCTNVGSGPRTGSVFCDEVGAWDISSTVATLEALAFNAATATSQNFGAATGWRSFNILGSAGVNGAANIYDAGENPGVVISCKMFVDLSLTQTQVDTNQIEMRLGDDFDWTKVEFSGPSTTSFPYLSFEYTESAGSESATIDAILPQLTADIAAVLTHPASIDATLPLLTADVAAKVTHKAAIAATLPLLTAKVYIEPLVAPADEESGAARIGEYRRLGMEFGRI